MLDEWIGDSQESKAKAMADNDTALADHINNVVSMLNTYGVGAGIRLIMTGVIIISVILLAGGRQPGAR